MKAIENFKFQDVKNYDSLKVRIFKELKQNERKVIDEIAEELKTSKNLIEKMRKLKQGITATLFRELINTKQPVEGCLKLEFYHHNEILKMYGNTELSMLKTFISRSPAGITLELFVLFNFSLFEIDQEDDFFYLVNGLLRLFYSICYESKRIKYRALIEYLLTETHQNENSYTDIVQSEFGNKYDYYYSVFCRTKKLKKIKLDEFIDDNLEVFIVRLDDVLFHFLNGQKFQINYISQWRYSKDNKKLIQNCDECPKSHSQKQISTPTNTQDESNETPKNTQTQPKSKNPNEKSKDERKRDNNPDKLVKSVKFHLDEKFNKYYMLRVLDICYIKSWNVLQIVMQDSKEIKVIDLNDKTETNKVKWNVEKAAKIPDDDWNIISFYYCNYNNMFLVALSQKILLLYFINPEYDFRKPVSNNNKMLLRNPLRIETFYLVYYMSICSYDGVIMNVTDAHNIYFWYQILDAVNASEFQPIEISYKRVEKTWNKLYTPSYCELRNLKKIAFSCFDGKIRLFDSQLCKISIEIEINTIAHTLREGHLDNTMMVFSFEKNFEIYEINQYYKESKLDSKTFGHISIIRAAEFIPEHDQVITCDDLNLIKTWDLKDMSCVQTYKIRNTSQINRIISMGKYGFIVLTSSINLFFYDALKTTNYSKVEMDNIEVKEMEKNIDVLKGDINVIPNIYFTPGYLSEKEFFLPISNEIRSYHVDNGMLTYIYKQSKIIPEKNCFFTTINYLEHPMDYLVAGMSNGNIVLIPNKKDDPIWCETIEVFNDKLHGGDDCLSTSSHDGSSGSVISKDTKKISNSIQDIQIDQAKMNFIVMGKLQIVIIHKKLGFNFSTRNQFLRTLKIDLLEIYNDGIYTIESSNKIEDNDMTSSDEEMDLTTNVNMSNLFKNKKKKQKRNTKDLYPNATEVYLKATKFIKNKGMMILHLSNDSLAFLDYNNFKLRGIYFDLELDTKRLFVDFISGIGISNIGKQSRMTSKIFHENNSKDSDPAKNLFVDSKSSNLKDNKNQANRTLKGDDEKNPSIENFTKLGSTGILNSSEQQNPEKKLNLEHNQRKFYSRKQISQFQYLEDENLILISDGLNELKFVTISEDFRLCYSPMQLDIPIIKNNSFTYIKCIQPYSQKKMEDYCNFKAGINEIIQAQKNNDSQDNLEKNDNSKDGKQDEDKSSEITTSDKDAKDRAQKHKLMKKRTCRKIKFNPDSAVNIDTNNDNQTKTNNKFSKQLSKNSQKPKKENKLQSEVNQTPEKKKVHKFRKKTKHFAVPFGPDTIIIEEESNLSSYSSESSDNSDESLEIHNDIQSNLDYTDNFVDTVDQKNKTCNLGNQRLSKVYENYDEIFHIKDIEVDNILAMTDNEGGVYIFITDFYLPIFQSVSERFSEFCKDSNDIFIDYSKPKYDKDENITCHVNFDKIAYKHLSKQFEGFHNTCTKKFGIDKISIKVDNVLQIKATNEEVINIKVKKFEDRYLLFVIDLRQNLKIFDLDLMVKDLLVPRTSRQFLSNNMKLNRYCTSHIELSSNTIHKWDLYGCYKKRLAQDALSTRRFLEGKYNFRFFDYKLNYNNPASVVPEENLELINKEAYQFFDKDRLKYVILPEQEELDSGMSKLKMRQEELRILSVTKKTDKEEDEIKVAGDEKHFLQKSDEEKQFMQNTLKEPRYKKILKKLDKVDALLSEKAQGKEGSTLNINVINRLKAENMDNYSGQVSPNVRNMSPSKKPTIKKSIAINVELCQSRADSTEKSEPINDLSPAIKNEDLERVSKNFANSLIKNEQEQISHFGSNRIPLPNLSFRDTGFDTPMFDETKRNAVNNQNEVPFENHLDIPTPSQGIRTNKKLSTIKQNFQKVVTISRTATIRSKKVPNEKESVKDDSKQLSLSHITDETNENSEEMTQRNTRKGLINRSLPPLKERESRKVSNKVAKKPRFSSLQAKDGFKLIEDRYGINPFAQNNKNPKDIEKFQEGCKNIYRSISEEPVRLKKGIPTYKYSKKRNCHQYDYLKHSYEPKFELLDNSVMHVTPEPLPKNKKFEPNASKLVDLAMLNTQQGNFFLKSVEHKTLKDNACDNNIHVSKRNIKPKKKEKKTLIPSLDKIVDASSNRNTVKRNTLKVTNNVNSSVEDIPLGIEENDPNQNTIQQNEKLFKKKIKDDIKAYKQDDLVTIQDVKNRLNYEELIRLWPKEKAHMLTEKLYGNKILDSKSKFKKSPKLMDQYKMAKEIIGDEKGHTNVNRKGIIEEENSESSSEKDIFALGADTNPKKIFTNKNIKSEVENEASGDKSKESETEYMSTAYFLGLETKTRERFPKPSIQPNKLNSRRGTFKGNELSIRDIETNENGKEDEGETQETYILLIKTLVLYF